MLQCSNLIKSEFDIMEMSLKNGVFTTLNVASIFKTAR